uniref:Replication factor A C-terminal domain-containing protein n=1 Tax=Setaria italica TaxID=4555 RepID=K3Y0Z7_SETIT
MVSLEQTTDKHPFLRYKLLFIATDGTAEVERICFGQIAQRIIGKSVDLVIRTIRRDEDFPPDIAGIASQKYTFAITMTNQSYYTRNKSYMVNSIIASYGRQRAIPQVGASSSNRHPAIFRTTDKDAPSPHLTDTPENNSARKRLYLTILLKMDR